MTTLKDTRQYPILPGSFDSDVDKFLLELEPNIVRGQFNAASKRLAAVLESTLASDGGTQAARALIEKMHLIAGNRRTKAQNVELDRRTKE